jgi:hypothetical protein
MRTFSCAAAADVISIDSEEDNCAHYDVLPLLLEFEDTESVDQD